MNLTCALIIKQGGSNIKTFIIYLNLKITLMLNEKNITHLVL